MTKLTKEPSLQAGDMTSLKNAKDPFRFLEAIQEVGRSLEKNYDSRSPLSHNQSRLVGALMRTDGQTQTELATTLHMHKVSIGIYVAELEGMGLIERKAHPTDGRAKCIYLTKLFHQLRHVGVEIITEILHKGLKGINPQEYDILLSCLDRLATNLREQEEDSAG